MYSDCISCVYPHSSQPYSIFLMYRAIFCLQQQTNAVIFILKPWYFPTREIHLWTVLMELLFPFLLVEVNSPTSSWILIWPLTSNAQPLLSQLGQLIAKTYLFPTPHSLDMVISLRKRPGDAVLLYLWRKNSLLICFAGKLPVCSWPAQGTAERAHRFLVVAVAISQCFAVATLTLTSS